MLSLSASPTPSLALSLLLLCHAAPAIAACKHIAQAPSGLSARARGALASAWSKRVLIRMPGVQAQSTAAHRDSHRIECMQATMPSELATAPCFQCGGARDHGKICRCWHDLMPTAFVDHALTCSAVKSVLASLTCSLCLRDGKDVLMGAVCMECTQGAVCQQCLDGLPPPCNMCGRASRHKACAKCRLAHYCSKDCQVSDWPTHRKACNGATQQSRRILHHPCWSCNNGGARPGATRRFVRCHNWHLRTEVALRMQAKKGFRAARRSAIVSNYLTLALMLRAWPRTRLTGSQRQVMEDLEGMRDACAASLKVANPTDDDMITMDTVLPLESTESTEHALLSLNESPLSNWLQREIIDRINYNNTPANLFVQVPAVNTTSLARYLAKKAVLVGMTVVSVRTGARRICSLFPATDSCQRGVT